MIKLRTLVLALASIGTVSASSDFPFNSNQPSLAPLLKLVRSLQLHKAPQANEISLLHDDAIHLRETIFDITMRQRLRQTLLNTFVEERRSGPVENFLWVPTKDFKAAAPTVSEDSLTDPTSNGLQIFKSDKTYVFTRISDGLIIEARMKGKASRIEGGLSKEIENTWSLVELAISGVKK